MLHDHRAGLEAWHALFESPFGNRLDEILLGERLEAFDERRADEPLLVGAMATVAGGGAPGPKAIHRVGIDHVTVDYLIRKLAACASALILCLETRGDAEDADRGQWQ